MRSSVCNSTQVSQIQEQSVEVVKVICQERLPERIVEQIVDAPKLPATIPATTKAKKGKHSK